MKTVEFEAGLLIRKQVRNLLDQAVSGYDFTYLETKGFLDSTFILKGNQNDIQKGTSVLSSHYEEDGS